MSFTCLLWVAIHWQFTAFYMQTACLLRKTLRARSDEELRRVKRTKTCLLWLEYLIYCAIVVFFALCWYLSDDGRAWIWTPVFYMSVSAADISMLVISLVSVLHIHRNSKVIERLGVKTDSTLMKLYAFCWIGLNLFDIVLFALSFYIIHEWQEHH